LFPDAKRHEGNVRNFKMVGNMGFAERDQCGSIRMWGPPTSGAGPEDQFCHGVVGTERVTVEDVHAYRMSLEAFWSGGPSRAEQANRSNTRRRSPTCAAGQSTAAATASTTMTWRRTPAFFTAGLWTSAVRVGGSVPLCKVYRNYIRNAALSPLVTSAAATQL